jgi:hypothetical protein
MCPCAHGGLSRVSALYICRDIESCLLVPPTGHPFTCLSFDSALKEAGKILTADGPACQIERAGVRTYHDTGAVQVISLANEETIGEKAQTYPGKLISPCLPMYCVHCRDATHTDTRSVCMILNQFECWCRIACSNRHANELLEGTEHTQVIPRAFLVAVSCHGKTNQMKTIRTCPSA